MDRVSELMKKESGASGSALSVSYDVTIDTTALKAKVKEYKGKCREFE